MKKVIILIGLVMSAATTSHAGEVIKMPVMDLLPTEMDYAFEIKTTKFDKVVIDCQSLRMGMSFANNGVVKSDIYLNEGMCGEILEFLFQSKADNLPVCIGLDAENQDLIISRETDECK